MITTEELDELMLAIKESRPKKMLEHFGKDSTGMMCVLTYLLDINRPVSAGEISAYMCVSTARIAVLIRKMEGKQLIEKKTDPTDARKAVISITESGKNIILEHKLKMRSMFAEVVESIGVDKFRQFIQLSDEIRIAVEDVLSKSSSHE